MSPWVAASLLVPPPHSLFTPFLYVCWMYFMPDTISRFTCKEAPKRGSARLSSPSPQRPPEPPPYPEGDFYPIFHTFLQHKGLLLEALQITCV